MTCGFDEIRRARVRSPTRPNASDSRRLRMTCVDVQDHPTRAGIGIRAPAMRGANKYVWPSPISRSRQVGSPSDPDGPRTLHPLRPGCGQGQAARLGESLNSTRTESDSATTRAGACPGVQCSGKRKNRPPDVSSRRRPV